MCPRLLQFVSMTTKKQAEEAGKLVRAARDRRGMSRDDVVKQMGSRNRNWVQWVEQGYRTYNGSVMEVSAADWLHLAAALGASPKKFMQAAGVPDREIRALSLMVADEGEVSTVDISELFEGQARLVESIVEEFRRANGSAD